MITQHTPFSIPYYQALDEWGVLQDADATFAQNFEWLKQVYIDMLRTRLFDQKCINLQRTGKLGTYPSCLGQEAISVVIGRLMDAEDVFVPYYRDLATQLIRGVPMHKLMLYWGGDERGNQHEQAQHDLPNCVPIATQITHGAGIATAMKLQRLPHAVVATCGDGATSRGDFYEPLNLAGTWQLPLVMVINNNQWAISVPRELQTACKTLAQKAIGAGVPGVQVDGNDPIALGDVLSQALHKARQGKGTTVIEAITYRLSDHTTADDATRYRPDQDVQQAKQQEPMVRLKAYLEQHQCWSDAEETALRENLSAQIQTEVNQYLDTPPQAASDIFDYLYDSLPIELATQRDHVQRKAHNEFGGTSFGGGFSS
ncbi:MAG: pyruvate dehydrogenase (acetyl-transferring) E1 component subunit alpha [Gammaproteobacteria bacterium]